MRCPHTYTRAAVLKAVERGVLLSALYEVLGYKSMRSFIRWLYKENC